MSECLSDETVKIQTSSANAHKTTDL